MRIKNNKLSFTGVADRDFLFLYAGDIPGTDEYADDRIVGLSLSRRDGRHIKHDITKPYPLSDESVDVYQAEDVFEHIEFSCLVKVIDEIYRVLKTGGYFRLSVPDYRCDVLYNRSEKDGLGNIVYDPFGGGNYRKGRVVNGGHLWFPRYETVKKLIDDSKFDRYKFYHYYDESGQSVTDPIDYSKGYVARTPDHDDRVQMPYRAMSIVVDMFK